VTEEVRGVDSDFPVAKALALARRAVTGFPQAAMFEVRDRGFGSVFQQLVACVVSIRTRDEDSLPASLRLFGEADSPSALATLGVDEIARLIAPSSFRDEKAERIREIARLTDTQFGGELPCDDATLRSFDGIGPKCANLALGVACGLSVVSVDIHVHRVTNRWGLVRTTTPEQTWQALERVVPDDLKVDINQVLMPFGKHVCTGARPRCSTCPVRPLCAQVGVAQPR
jgi:endonuclease-3